MKINNLVFFFLFSFILISGKVYAGDDDKGCCSDRTASMCETMSGHAGSDSTDKPASDVTTSDAVTGKVCLVSGEAIKDGEEVKFKYLDKTYDFCCENCLKKFKAEPLNYIKEELSCPVMGEAASKDIFVMVNGTKYYMCCEACNSKFEKNSEKYLNRLNEK